MQQKLQALGRQVAAAQAQRIKDNAQSQKSAKQSVLVSFFMKLWDYEYRGPHYNTDISAIYNTNILTAITPGTL